MAERYNIKKSDPKVGTTLYGYVRDKNRSLLGSGYRWYKANATPGERAVSLKKQLRIKNHNGETVVINPNGTLKTIIPASAKKNNTSSNSGKKISVKTDNSEEGNKSKSNTSSTSRNKSRSNVNNNSNSNKPKVTVASYGDFGGVEKGWRDTGQFNELIPRLSSAQLMWLDSKGISTENASSLQQGINNYFASVGSNKRISVDGKWGNQSQNALDEIFRDNSNEILNITQVLPQVVVESDLPPTRREGLEAGDVVSPVPQPQLITEESTTVNPEQLYTNYNTLPHYNRRQTRQWLRSMGVNPYSLSGRQRKIVRRDLNAGYIDPYEYLLYRNGGSLNGIPFYRKGTPKGGLPTAPKAEDRYKNGYKYGYRSDGSLYLFPSPLYTIADVKGVRTDYPFMSNQGEIQRTIFYAGDNPIDTVYTEIPNSVFPVERKQRYANSKNKTPEYETLKRRFNTAWNLAK